MNIDPQITRIQAYLRENVRRNSASASVPPFTAYFNPTDPLTYFNYAIPDQPITGGADINTPLAALREVFTARGRTPRFEFFEAFAPALPAALRAHGFIEEDRQWSMLCTPASYRAAPDVPGLEIIPIDAEAAEADIIDFQLAQRQGFDPDNQIIPTVEDAAHARQNFVTGGWRGFLGRLDGQPAGAAVYGRPIDGISEVAGVATRVAYRRRGIAAALTARATQAAFDRGVQIACLTAADEGAGRVYERAGFQAFSIMLAYIDAQRGEL